MKNPLISVIVPIYNTDWCTGLCIESIINQSYNNLEIILIDDGSIDRSPELCDLYALKDKRIKVVHKKNGGLVSARKAGMKIAQGEYVGYVDGDDWISRDYYYNIVKEIEKNNSDVVVSGWTRVLFQKFVQIDNNLPKDFYIDEKLDDLKTRMISNGEFYKPGVSTYVWNKVFRKELVYDFQMNVCDSLMTGEDALVSYGAILASYSVSIINNYGYYYRQHEKSMLKRKTDFFNDSKRMKILYNSLLSYDNGNDTLKKQVIEYVLSCCIVRFGALTPGLEEYVFNKDFRGKSVVVYGAGSFGQLFMSNLLRKKDCNVISWLDEDFWEYRRCCLNVDPFESVVNLNYDYLIVTSMDACLADKICNEFVSLGVRKNKIVKIDFSNADKEKMLIEYLEIGGDDERFGE